MYTEICVYREIKKIILKKYYISLNNDKNKTDEDRNKTEKHNNKYRIR